MSDQIEANDSPMSNDHGELTRNLIHLLGGAFDSSLDAVSKAKACRIAADALLVKGYRKYRTASALKIGRIIAMELESTKRSSATHDLYTKGWVSALLMVQDHLPHEDTEIDREHGGLICSECGWHFVSKFLQRQTEAQTIAHDIHVFAKYGADAIHDLLAQLGINPDERPEHGGESIAETIALAVINAPTQTGRKKP